MKDPIIYATGNQRLNGDFNVSHYIVEKSENFLDWLELLIDEIFEKKGEGLEVKKVHKNVQDDEGNFVREEVYLKDINKMIDIHEHYPTEYKSNGDRIDLFYGKNRVFITFRKSRDSRVVLQKFFQKHAQWVSVNEVTQVPTYAQLSS